MPRGEDSGWLRVATRNQLSRPLPSHRLLEQTLLSSSTPEFQSRVVNVSSAGHHMSSVVLDNINLDGEYEAWKAYGNAKTACIWMTNEIEADTVLGVCTASR